MIQSNPRRCCARESPPSTRFAIPARGLATLWRCTAWAASGISEFSSRRGRASAPSRSTAASDKEALAKKLGASDDIDTATQDPAKALTAMGGAKAILATVTNNEAMQAIAGGLGANGVMMVIGAVGPLTVNSFDLIGKSAGVRGWYSGVSRDSEDTLAFSKLNNVVSMNEIYPLEKAQEAYDRMLSGKARFRVVLRVDA